MSDDAVHLDVANGVARLTLARPETRNRMDDDFFIAFGDAVGQLVQRRDEVRAVVLAAQGAHFCVGGDVGAFAAAGDRLPDAVLDGTYRINRALGRLARLDAPMIASVQGAAAGGGAAIAAGADIVIAADDATFAAAYSAIGLSCDLGASRAFAARMGIARARRFLLLAERLDAPAAAAVGLVDEIVPRDRLESATAAWAERLAEGPTRAYGAIRRLIGQALTTPLETQLEDEAAALASTAGTSDGREGVQAFVARRPARFTGR